jgi:uncharacterized membrane protein YdbT with pleckstrin-like domain
LKLQQPSRFDNNNPHNKQRKTRDENQGKAMNILELFKDTDFSETENGSFTSQPSLLVNTNYVARYVFFIIAIFAFYIWIYPRFQPSVFLLIVPLSITGVMIGIAIIRTQFIEYEIREDKLIVRKGVLRRHMEAVNIGRIQNSQVNQSFLDQIFGIGTVKVNTDDSTVGIIWMEGMHKPDELRAALLDASEVVRKARGMYEFANP